MTDTTRRVARALMAGERPSDVARRFGLTAGRVSQRPDRRQVSQR